MARRVCKHCKEPYGARAGRGLCGTCWRKPEVRQLYPPLAAFGGKGAVEFARRVFAERRARRGW